MTKVTETDLRELKDLILGSEKKIEQSLQGLDRKIDDTKVELEKKLDNLEKKSDVLAEKLSGIDTRLSNLENRTTLQVNWFLAIITGLVGGLLTVIGKLTFFPNANSL
jgi:hypothetical protein